MPVSSGFNLNQVVLDANRRGFPEPTLLPHLASGVSSKMLLVLMDAVAEAAGGRGAFPPWPRLLSAVCESVAKRMEETAEDESVMELLTHHSVLYSHIDKSLVNKAVALTMTQTDQWYSEDRAERLCRLAAKHPQHQAGALVDLAMSELLDLEPAQRTRPNAWFFKVASAAERRNIIQTWVELEWFDLEALTVMFTEAETSEREQLTGWLLDQNPNEGADEFRVIAIASVLHLLANPARVRAVGILGPALARLAASQPPWWIALVCSSVLAVAPETVIEPDDLDPVWRNWIASFSSVLPDGEYADVLRAHPGSIEWMESSGYPGLTSEQSDVFLDDIFGRWGGAEMAAMSSGSEPVIERASTAAPPDSSPQPVTRGPETEPGGFRGRLSNVLGGLLGGILGGRKSNDNEEESVTRGPTAAMQPAISPRHLQADVLLADGMTVMADVPKTLTKGFISGARHTIKISVGRGASLQVAEALTEPVFSDGSDSEALAVRLIFNEQVSAGTISLPRDTAMNSTIWQASLQVPDDALKVEATVVVLHKDRVLQVATLAGPVFSDMAALGSGEGKLVFAVTADVHDFAGLAGRESFDASVVTDGNSGAAFAGANFGVRDLKGVDVTIDRMTDKLFKTSEAVAIAGGGGTPAAFEQLLVFLAAHGKVLHSTLIRQLMPALDSAKRIQIVSTNPSAILPLEFVYDGPSPMSNATLCANWQQSLEKGVCPECANLPDDQRSATICPLHFWALSKVIERHAPAKPEVDGHDFKVSTQVSPQRKNLVPLTGAVFAASDNVPESLVESTLALLNETVAHCDEARTWSDWVRSIETRSPSLLVSLPHNALDPLLEISTLEIGNGDELRAGEVSPKLVRNETSEVGPIVLLLGCQTAVDQRQPFHTFVGEFRHNGAAIVIGTLSTVLAEHAAPVVQAIITELAQQPADGDTMGDMLLRIRRRMFAQGILIALAVAAFGDADWALTKSEIEVPVS